jgi:hypothetical protein
MKAMTIFGTEQIQLINEVAIKMMKTWSANILYAWKKAFVRSFKILCKTIPGEA